MNMLIKEKIPVEKIPLLEEILEEWKEIIGKDYQGYKNHVYRMINFCFALQDCNQEEQEKIIIAGCFHDVGIWTHSTLDYVTPSIPPAKKYLRGRNLEHWSTEVGLMISEHHYVKEYKDENYPLVELFRKGDLVDFSLGLIKFGISKEYISDVNAKFPNAGFHRNLVKLAAEWFLKNPLNPAPMMKW